MNALDPAPQLPVEEELHRLRAYQKAGRHDEAFQGAQALLEALPENRDLLLIAASSLRHQGKIVEALTVLERLERTQPRFSLMHQERGLCYVACRDAPR